MADKKIISKINITGTLRRLHVGDVVSLKVGEAQPFSVRATASRLKKNEGLCFDVKYSPKSLTITRLK